MIPSNILDSIITRFFVGLEDHEKNAIERIFFILEEAHWFLIDNYMISNISLAAFSKEVLEYIGVRMNIDDALKDFVKYRQSVKVYGAIIVNQDLTRVLTVKEKKKTGNYSFPKGKKCMNEEGIECAVREIYEEIGYDVQRKIFNLPIIVFDKITFYFVFNVKTDFPFQTQTKKEIEEIKWLSIKRLSRGEYGKGYSIVLAAFKKAATLFDMLKKSRFKFDVEKINKRIDKLWEGRCSKPVPISSLR